MTTKKLSPLSSKEAFLKTLGEHVPDRPDWVYVLDAAWPECHNDENGFAVLEAEDAEWLQLLCDRFGLDIKVAEHGTEVLGHVYDVCVLSLGMFVDKKLSFPAMDLRAYLHDWPAEWVDYIEAVAKGDLRGAKRLAKVVQPLSPPEGYPPGVHVMKKGLDGVPLR